MSKTPGAASITPAAVAPATAAPLAAAVPAAAAPPPATAVFFQKSSDSWQSLTPTPGGSADEQKVEQERAAKAKRSLHDQLLSSLQMQHVIVLAGSGTSLGSTVGGPSMWNLWDNCVNGNPDTGTATPRIEKLNATQVMTDVGYDKVVSTENIEALLSQCEAYLQFKPTAANVAAFVKESKATILKKCSEFIDETKSGQLDAHRTFLHKLSRRRVRDSRLKLFTTNYDLCFEGAAGKQGLVAIDGFSFSQPRYFDSRFFQYDIVRRTPATSELGTPLEGVFQLLKLHGSVNWQREGDTVAINSKPDPGKACLIYPAKGKYQQSYIQPHLELVSQFFSSLREPNTCVLAIGFGFNDDHLSEPILAAVKTNPHMRLIVVSQSAKANAEEIDATKTNKYWKTWHALAKEGSDILLIGSTFDDFSKLIPDLKSLTPAEQLAKSVAALAGGH